MTRLLLVAGLASWMGATLVLAELRWFGRVPMVDRLAPFVPGGVRHRPGRPAGVTAGLVEVLAPLAEQIGAVIGRVVGVNEALDRRLRRVHAPVDVAGFRLRQVGAAAGALAAGAGLATVAGVPPVLGLLLVAGSPTLVFLIIEQRLASASERWQQRLALEAPVGAEQLAMLLGAGFSLGSALARMAQRGRGAMATDLVGVTNRIRQGLDEVAALGEWADLAGVPAIDRLVGVLSLHRTGGDLAALVAEEARSARRELHRRRLAAMERRSQQVWIPVTVATLVPGSIFLAVPFLQALRAFGGT